MQLLSLLARSYRTDIQDIVQRELSEDIGHQQNSQPSGLSIPFQMVLTASKSSTRLTYKAHFAALQCLLGLFYAD
jgi:hypothetical protein